MKNKIFVLLTLIFILSGCNFFDSNVSSDITSDESAVASAYNEPVKDTVIKLSFYGDLLIHDTVFNAALQSDGSYNFENQFSAIGSYLKKSDYVIGNLETNFAGKARRYSGYPTFNAPEEMCGYLRDTLGTNLIVNANNHCLDKGFSGLKSTISFLDTAGISHTGTFASLEESQKSMIADIKGIKVAFINYTYGTNGISLPAGNEYCVNVIDKDKIKSDAYKARADGAEYIIAVMHWGTEYQRTPSNEQKNLAQWIYENTEVDSIIGGHPHVVQTIEEIPYERNGEAKKGIVAYSMGNFTGDQSKSYTDTGIIVNLQLKKSGETGEISVSGYTFTPVYIDKNPDTKYNFRVISVFQGIYDFEHNNDALITADEYTRLNVIADNYKNEVSKCDIATIDTEINSVASDIK